MATVDENGKVTAVANGTAAITVTTEDGNKTDSCVVTVEIPEPGHVHDDPLKKVEEKPATCTQEAARPIMSANPAEPGLRTRPARSRSRIMTA